MIIIETHHQRGRASIAEKVMLHVRKHAPNVNEKDIQKSNIFIYELLTKLLGNSLYVG